MLLSYLHLTALLMVTVVCLSGSVCFSGLCVLLFLILRCVLLVVFPLCRGFPELFCIVFIVRFFFFVGGAILMNTLNCLRVLQRAGCRKDENVVPTCQYI